MDPLLQIITALNNSQVQQRSLCLQIQTLLKEGKPLPNFRDIAFRVYSQNDEDGILLYIFSLIGFSNRILVDIGCGKPIGSNSANLICNWGFWGLLVDTDINATKTTQDFYTTHPDTSILPPVVITSWITAENINHILESYGIKGEIDLFSLDVDGIDYWLLKALSIVNPRVIIVEAHNFMGEELSVTIPYSPNFNRFDIHKDFFGASVLAMVKLAKAKGYRLVACNRYGFNLFFVRNDIARNILSEIDISECFRFEPELLRRKRQIRLRSVLGLPWVEV